MHMRMHFLCQSFYMYCTNKADINDEFLIAVLKFQRHLFDINYDFGLCSSQSEKLNVLIFYSLEINIKNESIT